MIYQTFSLGYRDRIQVIKRTIDGVDVGLGLLINDAHRIYLDSKASYHFTIFKSQRIPSLFSHFPATSV